MLSLSLWQISVIAVMAVIAVLIGALVVLARTLANKVGKAYAALRRIEEVLIAANAPKSRVSTLGTSMEAVGSAHGPLSSDIGVRDRRKREMPVRETAHREAAVPEMLLAEGAMHEMSVGGMSATERLVPERDRRVSYLTVRDLKVMGRSGRRRSDTEISQEAGAQFIARQFGAAQEDSASADARLPASHAAVHQPGANQAGAAHADAIQADSIQARAGHAGAGPEPTGLSSSSAVLQELATATSEVRSLLNESAQLAGAPIAVEVAPEEPITEAHEEMYAYSELSNALVPPAPSEPELLATPAREPNPRRELAFTDVAREPAPTEVAGERALIEAAREPAPAEAASEPARIEAPHIKAHPVEAPSIAAPETAPEPDFVLASPVESYSAPAEATIETTAPVAAVSNPTTSGEDQPAPPISTDTEAELAEKRRKRTAEMILAHHRRRRARGH